MGADVIERLGYRDLLRAIQPTLPDPEHAVALFERLALEREPLPVG